MHWDRLPRACGFSSLEIPQCCWDMVLGTLLCVALLGQGATRGTRRSLHTSAIMGC